MHSISKDSIIENCILSMAKGNIDAMDELYKTISKDVYAYALSKVKNKLDAEDILQDTFMRVYQKAQLYTPKGKPMAWIITLESNIINRYFENKSRSEVSCDEIVINTPDEVPEVKKDTSIDHMLNGLNDFEKEVVTLHLVSNMKFKDIANMLDKPLSTILSKYNRAIKKLKILYKEE